MANNRMLLMHRPTGKAVYLGKRMGRGWYDVPDDIKKRIEALFELVDAQESAEADQDDFCVALEKGASATLVESDWQYGEKDEATGIIDIKRDVPFW